MADEISTCGHEREPIPVEAQGQQLVVDIHCHLNVRSADELLRADIPDPPNPLAFMSQDSMQTNGKLFAEIGKKLNGVDDRISDMDRLGVDVQAISPSPGQYYYFAPAELGRDCARTVNDGIAEAVAGHPDRLVGLGTVPLQNTEMAIAELRRCVNELGLRGIEVGTVVSNSDVDDPELAAERLRPFFAAAEELDVLVFMHPLGFSHGERLAEHYLDNILGNPIESSIALSRLIFAGVLDEYPQLKLLIAHGGGYLPGYWGRMDHAYRAREDCRRHISREPSSYMRQVWLDTLVFDTAQLDFLVKTHGADKLCLGTDYPFDMSEPDPVGFHQGLSESEREKVMGRNAAALLGLRSGAEQ